MKRFGSKHVKMLKRHSQGEKIPVHFWITWALVKSVILILGGERREENLEKETVASLHEYKLDAGDIEKITTESKRCFSHGFTVLEETESKPPPLTALTIATAPPRETADLYPPPPEDEDWDKYSEVGDIEEEMCYVHIHPDKGLGRKNNSPLMLTFPSPYGGMNCDCCFLSCLI
jgi:hypothetical protein